MTSSSGQFRTSVVFRRRNNIGVAQRTWMISRKQLLTHSAASKVLGSRISTCHHTSHTPSWQLHQSLAGFSDTTVEYWWRYVRFKTADKFSIHIENTQGWKNMFFLRHVDVQNPGDVFKPKDPSPAAFRRNPLYFPQVWTCNSCPNELHRPARSGTDWKCIMKLTAKLEQTVTQKSNTPGGTDTGLTLDQHWTD